MKFYFITLVKECKAFVMEMNAIYFLKMPFFNRLRVRKKCSRCNMRIVPLFRVSQLNRQIN